MQKILLFVTGLILLCSCSQNSFDEDIPLISNSNHETNAVNTELMLVQVQIDSLNKDMFPEHIQSRGLRDFFKKFWAVTTCDAVGGMFGFLWGGPIGAAATATVCSGVAALTDSKNISIKDEATPKDKDLELIMMPMNSPQIALSSTLIPAKGTNVKATREDSIGYYHNKILLDLKNGSDSNTYTIDNIIDAVAANTSIIYDEPEDKIHHILNCNKSFFDDILKQNFAYQNQDETLHEIFNNWKFQYPEQSEKLSVLESFFEGVSNYEIGENDGKYLGKVLNIIDQSSMDEDTKRDIKNGIIVGNASYQLWNIQE